MSHASTTTRQDLKRFAAICRFEKRYIPAYALASVLVCARNFFITFLSASLAACAVAAAQQRDLALLWQGTKWFALALAAFVCIDTGSGYGQALTLQKMSNHLKERMMAKVLHSSLLLGGPLGQRGQVLARVNQDVETVMGMFIFSLVIPIMYLISGVGATVLLAGRDPRLCVGLYILAFLLLGAQTLLGKHGRRIAAALRLETSGALEMLLSAFGQAESVKQQYLAPFVRGAFAQTLRRFHQKSTRAGVVNGALGLVGGVSTVLSGIGVLFFEVLCPPAGGVSLGDVVLLSQMAPLVLTMVSSLGSAINQLQSALVGVDRVMDLLELPDEAQQDRDKATFAFTNTTPVLAARHLDCVLGEQTILRQADVTLESGLVAIMGESGVGKTTFLRLVVGLYPYSGGSLQLCGQEVAAHTRQSVRGAITYVAQDAPLIEGTLRQNLTLGQAADAFSDEQLWAALALAAADEWFGAGDLDGFVVQEKAHNLSGGQRQCLALARAFLADSPITIFDEIFAGVDRERTTRLLQNIRRALGGRCVWIVTHDPALAALCDCRVTFGRGATADAPTRVTYS